MHGKRSAGFYLSFDWGFQTDSQSSDNAKRLRDSCCGGAQVIVDSTRANREVHGTIQSEGDSEEGRIQVVLSRLQVVGL